MSSDAAFENPQFYGGRICLDFANTVDWRCSAEPRELMPDYSAFLDWSVARKTLGSAASAALRRSAAASPERAASVLSAAHQLRSEIWRAGEAAQDRGPITLDALNQFVASAPAQPGLIACSGGYVHDLRGDALEEPIWPVLWSLTTLIASDDLSRTRCCQARGCGWLFVDESPNRARLWCSNEGCGNRERARRAYLKRRSP